MEEVEVVVAVRWLHSCALQRQKVAATVSDQPRLWCENVEDEVRRRAPQMCFYRAVWERFEFRWCSWAGMVSRSPRNRSLHQPVQTRSESAWVRAAGD